MSCLIPMGHQPLTILHRRLMNTPPLSGVERSLFMRLVVHTFGAPNVYRFGFDRSLRLSMHFVSSSYPVCFVIHLPLFNLLPFFPSIDA